MVARSLKPKSTVSRAMPYRSYFFPAGDWGALSAGDARLSCLATRAHGIITTY